MACIGTGLMWRLQLGLIHDFLFLFCFFIYDVCFFHFQSSTEPVTGLPPRPNEPGNS